jgi:hypothetical protein
LIGRDIEMPLVGSLADLEALDLARPETHPQQVVGGARWVRVAAPYRSTTGADPLAQPGIAER